MVTFFHLFIRVVQYNNYLLQAGMNSPVARNVPHSIYKNSLFVFNKLEFNITHADSQNFMFFITEFCKHKIKFDYLNLLNDLVLLNRK